MDIRVRIVMLAITSLLSGFCLSASTAYNIPAFVCGLFWALAVYFDLRNDMYARRFVFGMVSTMLFVLASCVTKVFYPGLAGETLSGFQQFNWASGAVFILPVTWFSFYPVYVVKRPSAFPGDERKKEST